MRISVSEAKARLTDLVRRAEAGDEVILTDQGHAAVRLVPVAAAVTATERRDLLNVLRGSASANGDPAAEKSQDFLYDDDGLPH